MVKVKLDAVTVRCSSGQLGTFLRSLFLRHDDHLGNLLVLWRTRQRRGWPGLVVASATSGVDVLVIGIQNVETLEVVASCSCQSSSKAYTVDAFREMLTGSHVGSDGEWIVRMSARMMPAISCT